jgi:hypothetical protein
MKNDQFKMKIGRIWHHGAPGSNPAQGDCISQRAGSETGVPTWQRFLKFNPALINTAGEIKLTIKGKIKGPRALTLRRYAANLLPDE